MKQVLIQKYIDMITKEDIKKFALANGESLTSEEVDIIYRAIKDEWKTIIYDDYHVILNRYKNSFTVDKLKKIENLIILYKDKYRNFI